MGSFSLIMGGLRPKRGKKTLCKYPKILLLQDFKDWATVFWGFSCLWCPQGRCMINILTDFTIKQWEFVMRNFTGLQTNLFYRSQFNLQFPWCSSFKIFFGQIFFGCSRQISQSALCLLMESAGLRLSDGKCWIETHSFTFKKQQSLPSFHAAISALHPSFRWAWVGGNKSQPLRTSTFAWYLFENSVMASLWSWKMIQ